jgi:hypothetical protein
VNFYLGCFNSTGVGLGISGAGVEPVQVAQSKAGVVAQTRNPTCLFFPVNHLDRSHAHSFQLKRSGQPCRASADNEDITVFGHRR